MIKVRVVGLLCDWKWYMPLFEHAVWTCSRWQLQTSVCLIVHRSGVWLQSDQSVPAGNNIGAQLCQNVHRPRGEHRYEQSSANLTTSQLSALLLIWVVLCKALSFKHTSVSNQHLRFSCKFTLAGCSFQHKSPQFETKCFKWSATVFNLIILFFQEPLDQ